MGQTNIEQQLSTLFIPPVWMILFSLLLMAGIFWTTNKRIGFQVLYLTFFSLSMAHIITIYIPYLLIANEMVPLTHLNIQMAMTFFAFFLPLSRNRYQIVFCLLPPIILGIIHILFTNTPVFSIIGAILIGGFIIYAFYHTLEWIGSMPEPYILVFSIVLPMFIAAIIYPNEHVLLFPGILLGLGIGATIESYKIRLNLNNQGLLRKVIATTFGAITICFVYLDTIYYSILVLPTISIGIILGLWITFIVPACLVLFRIYKGQRRTTKYF